MIQLQAFFWTFWPKLDFPENAETRFFTETRFKISRNSISKVKKLVLPHFLRKWNPKIGNKKHIGWFITAETVKIGLKMTKLILKMLKRLKMPKLVLKMPKLVLKRPKLDLKRPKLDFPAFYFSGLPQNGVKKSLITFGVFHFGPAFGSGLIISGGVLPSNFSLHQVEFQSSRLNVETDQTRSKYPNLWLYFLRWKINGVKCGQKTSLYYYVTNIVEALQFML